MTLNVFVIFCIVMVITSEVFDITIKVKCRDTDEILQGAIGGNSSALTFFYGGPKVLIVKTH